MPRPQYDINLQVCRENTYTWGARTHIHTYIRKMNASTESFNKINELQEHTHFPERKRPARFTADLTFPSPRIFYPRDGLRGDNSAFPQSILPEAQIKRDSVKAKSSAARKKGELVGRRGNWSGPLTQFPRLIASFAAMAPGTSSPLGTGHRGRGKPCSRQ